MAGLTVTVGAVDITAYVDVYSIIIEEVGTELVGVAKFLARDHSGTISIDAKDSVDIDDDGTTLFAGEVVDADMGQEGIVKTWRVTCQDNNILLDERVVESESWSAGETDAGIINDLFTAHRSDINSTTYVSTIDASMEAIAFAGLTLRECMDDICRRTGGRYYVDYNKNLHYFATEANNAAFGLSTSPDMSLWFPFGGFKKVESAGRLANKVFVQGKEVSGWVEDAASIVTYGERHAISRDQRITTAQGVTDRGTAILDRYDLPRTTFELWTEKDGLRGGQNLQVTNQTWGILAASYYIRKIVTRFQAADGDAVRRHFLWLDDEPPEPSSRLRYTELRVATVETIVNDMHDYVYDTDAPATPGFTAGNITTGLDLDPQGNQVVYVQCTWGAVGDADLDHYDIQLSTSADFSGYTLTRSHPAGGDRIERFLPVLGNTVHYARVRAVDWVGNTSAWSSTQNVTSDTDGTPPGQVTGLSAASSRTLVGLDWTANSESDLARYEIQRADDSAGSPGAFATIAHADLSFYIDQDFTDLEISNEDTFWYKVRAIDTSGNTGTWSANVSAQIGLIEGDHIAAATIIGDHIAANTIEAGHINVSELSAISADLGTCTAGTLTAATIRTAASGARVQLDSVDGLQCINASAATTAQIRVNGSGFLGAAQEITWNTAGTISVDGGIVADGTIVASAFSNSLGDMFFSAASGLLLLGPGGKLETTAWTSTRRQEATLSGAFHLETGRWEGTQALVVEDATTNEVKNPVFEDDVTTEWTLSQGGAGGAAAQDTGRNVFGSACCKLTAGSSWVLMISNNGSSTIANGESVTISCYVLRESDVTVRLRVRDTTNATMEGYVDASGPLGVWERLAVTWENDSGGAVNVAVTVSNRANDSSTEIWFDAVQMELDQDHATSFCYGDRGSGYAWSGTANASKSTRTATKVDLDDLVPMLEGNAAFSIAAWVRVAYDHDGAWPAAQARIWDIYEDANNYIRCQYNDVTEDWRLYVTAGGTTATLDSAAQTFDDGEWAHVVCTIDFTGNSYVLYVNGEEADTDTTALSAISALTYWSIGRNYNSALHYGNYVVAELAVFDSVLTASSVAQLYCLQRPLVDAGAIDKPGIYLFDGQFRIASSSTGARIEITKDGIAAYCEATYGGTQTVDIANNGVAYFGSDISDHSTTALIIAGNPVAWNGETLQQGDVLFGDNDTNKANILWDKSAGILYFRSGKTNSAYIDTDGAFTAGTGETLKIDGTNGIRFVYGGNCRNGLHWYDAFATANPIAQIRYQASTDNGIVIRSGSQDSATFRAIYLQQLTSAGITTPLRVTSAERMGIWESSPDAIVHIRKRTTDTQAIPVLKVENADTDSGKAVLLLTQGDIDKPYISFYSGTVATGKTEQDEYLMIDVDGSTKYLRCYS